MRRSISQPPKYLLPDDDECRLDRHGESQGQHFKFPKQSAVTQVRPHTGYSYPLGQLTYFFTNNCSGPLRLRVNLSFFTDRVAARAKRNWRRFRRALIHYIRRMISVRVRVACERQSFWHAVRIFHCYG